MSARFATFLAIVAVATVACNSRAPDPHPAPTAASHGPRVTSIPPRERESVAPHEPSEIFPLVLSADRRNLVDALGRPFLIQGDSAWALAAELSKEDAIRYLDDREQRGFNAILFSVIEAEFTHHTPPWRNAAGDEPFVNESDWTTANEAYFSHVDWLFQELEARGMLALAVPAYLGSGCGPQGWCERMFQNGVNRLEQYGRFLGERYRDTPNIVWVQGGDLTPSTSGDPSQLDLVNAVADGIVAGEAGAHYHAGHWGRGTSGADLRGLDWLDIDTTYAAFDQPVYEQVLSDFERDAGLMPLFLLEASYENEHGTSMTGLRSQMYQPVLSGGCGFIFGNYPIWSFWDPGDPDWPVEDGAFPDGWATALGSDGAESSRIAGDFFRSVPWQTLQPDTDQRIVKAGAGTYGSENYGLAASTPDRRLVIVYFPGTIAVTIDMGALPGPMRARYLDPALGTYSDLPGSPLTASGLREIAPPGLNGDGSEDWLLVLEAE